MIEQFLATLKNLWTTHSIQAIKFFKHHKKLLKSLLKKKKLKTLILSATKEWKISSIIFFVIVFLYYGLGAYVSSNLNNNLDYKIKTTNQRNTTLSLIYSLKSQIDDAPWTPSLPLIFPASILDNLPNFQLGVKDGIKHYIKQLSALYLDSSLKEAGTLLDYSPDIWLFSQDKNDKLSPGSAKQYRKALGRITDFSNVENILYPLTTENLSYQLNSINKLLDKQIINISKHSTEHCTDIFDNQADDIFFYTQGILYSTYYYLTGLSKDYQDLIVATNTYNDLTSALKQLKNAINLSPVIIKNSSPENVYSANHLLYLSNYIAKAQNKLYQISKIIEQNKTKDIPQ